MFTLVSIFSIIFLLVFLPFKLPIPFLISSHRLAVILFSIISPYILYQIISNSQQINKAKHSFLPLLYFLLISTASLFSFVPTITVKNLLITLIGILIFRYLSIQSLNIKQVKIIYRLIYLIALLGSLFSLLGAIWPGTVLAMSDSFFNFDRSISMIHQEFIQNNRIHLITPLHLLSPFPVFHLLYKIKSGSKKRNNLWLNLIFLYIILISINVANFRSLTLSVVLGIIILIFFLKGKVKKSGVNFLLIHFLTIAILTLLISQNIKVNIFQRFLLRKEYETLTQRIEIYQNSWDMFKSHPLVGTGYGNFWLTSKFQSISLKIDDRRTIFFPEIETPHAHNIFLNHIVETGLIGTIGFTTMIVSFLIEDVKFIKRIRFSRNSNLDNKIPFIISSWIFILSNLTEGVLIRQSMILFLFFRGVIEGLNHLRHI